MHCMIVNVLENTQINSRQILFNPLQDHILKLLKIELTSAKTLIHKLFLLASCVRGHKLLMFSV